MRRWVLLGCGLLVVLGVAGWAAPAFSDPVINRTLDLLVTDCTHNPDPIAGTPVSVQLYRNNATVGFPVTKNTNDLGRVSFPIAAAQVGDICVVTISPNDQPETVQFTFDELAWRDDLIVWWPSENPYNDPCAMDECCTTGDPIGESGVLWHIRYPD